MVISAKDAKEFQIWRCFDTFDFIISCRYLRAVIVAFQMIEKLWL